MRTLGNNGPSVSDIGLGCMGMSDLYGPADETESIATIHAALDAGLTLLDTGDYYGMGHNELLIRDALKRAEPRPGGDQREVRRAARPEGELAGHRRPTCRREELPCLHAATARNGLGRHLSSWTRRSRCADRGHGGRHGGDGQGRLRQAHWPVGSRIRNDPARAAVHPISDLQIEYSLISRGIESHILPTCRELGVGITAYGVLSRGLISGHWTTQRSTGPHDFRSHSPRFSADNIEHNLRLVEQLRRVAVSKDATVAQVAIAWVLARGADIVPLVGARRRERLTEALGAMKLTLTGDDLQQIERAVPVKCGGG